MTTQTVTIRAQDYGRFMRRLGAKFVPAVERGVLSGVKKSTAAGDVLQSNTVHAPAASPNGFDGAVNTGAFRRAWFAERIDHGARVYNKMPYAPIIEWGRRPVGWQYKRGAAAGTGKKSLVIEQLARWAHTRMGLSAAAARGAAFAIANAINRRGLLGRHVLEDSIPGILKNVDAEILRELRKAATGK